ncbi:uncharacterized protein LOC127708704 [Mytilus californianus]|nr:uncharacterized protein LOC127708704 [Mytilus californianus]
MKMMAVQKDNNGHSINDFNAKSSHSQGSLASKEMTTLDSIVAKFRNHTYAESTKKTYQNYLKSYMEFCRRINIALVPLSPLNLARYVAYLSARLQFNSINNYLSIIRLLHLEAGITSPLESFFMDSVLKGAKRVLGCTVHSKLPLTPKILNEIFTLLSLSSSKDLCFWAACLVAFFSFLRKSNLFAPSLSAFDPVRQLSREDITFHAEGVRLRVVKTKTIQFSERVLEIPLPRVNNSHLCPSKALLLNFKQVPAISSPSPVFLYLVQGKVTPLTYATFVKMLKHNLSLLNYDSTKYSGHSFRRGGASFALECGIPADHIQSQGDWKSDAYKLYLDPSFAHRQKVMNKFAAALGK